MPFREGEGKNNGSEENMNGEDDSTSEHANECSKGRKTLRAETRKHVSEIITAEFKVRPLKLSQAFPGPSEVCPDNLLTYFMRLCWSF